MLYNQDRDSFLRESKRFVLRSFGDLTPCETSMVKVFLSMVKPSHLPKHSSYMAGKLPAMTGRKDRKEERGEKGKHFLSSQRGNFEG